MVKGVDILVWQRVRHELGVVYIYNASQGGIESIPPLPPPQMNPLPITSLKHLAELSECQMV